MFTFGFDQIYLAENCANGKRDLKNRESNFDFDAIAGIRTRVRGLGSPCPTTRLLSRACYSLRWSEYDINLIGGGYSFPAYFSGLASNAFLQPGAQK